MSTLAAVCCTQRPTETESRNDIVIGMPYVAVQKRPFSESKRTHLSIGLKFADGAPASDASVWFAHGTSFSFWQISILYYT
jgi:hypothetical protein